MPTARLDRRLTAWIAALAILFGGLAPALAHALHRSAGGEGLRAEVCTAAGAVVVALGDEGGAADNRGGGIDGHVGCCPYCGAHALAFALPVTASALVPAAIRGKPLPALSDHAPRATRVWAASQPRAPPPPIIAGL